MMQEKGRNLLQQTNGKSFAYWWKTLHHGEKININTNRIWLGELSGYFSIFSYSQNPEPVMVWTAIALIGKTLLLFNEKKDKNQWNCLPKGKFFNISFIYQYASKINTGYFNKIQHQLIRLIKKKEWWRINFLQKRNFNFFYCINYLF